MKVLIFMTQFYQLSGAERLALELAEVLNKRGIHCDILSMYKEETSGTLEVKKSILEKGIPEVHFLGMDVHPPIYSLIPAIIKLRRLIKKNKYDIIETSMVSPTVIASWASIMSKVKHIAGVHDVFDKKRHNGTKFKFWKFSIKCNTNIWFYAISDHVKKHWIRYSGTPKENTTIIYNAIKDDFFDVIVDMQKIKSEFGIPGSGKLALFVGRLLKRKGIDTIYEALRPIVKEENLYMLFIGGKDNPEKFYSDDKGLLKKLMSRIEDDSLSERIRFVGRRDDIPNLMASSDILIHPARIEGFGLVLAEAMAAGSQIVASNVDGIPEVLLNTDYIMVSPDNPEILRKAIRDTISRKPNEKERAIKKAKSLAEKFRVNQRADEMIKLFKNVLQPA